MKRELTILVDNIEHVVTVSRRGDGLVVERGDEIYEVIIRSDRLVDHDAAAASTASAAVRQTAAVRQPATVSHPPKVAPAPGPAPAPAAPKTAPAGAVSVPSPMVGVVREVHATNGAAVVEGDRLVTMEAMKMEIYVTAPCPGRVAEVLCSIGDTVTDGTELVRISAAGADAS